MNLNQNILLYYVFKERWFLILPSMRTHIQTIKICWAPTMCNTISIPFLIAYCTFLLIRRKFRLGKFKWFAQILTAKKGHNKAWNTGFSNFAFPRILYSLCTMCWDRALQNPAKVPHLGLPTDPQVGIPTTGGNQARRKQDWSGQQRAPEANPTEAGR